jgi:hypothetical protein
MEETLKEASEAPVENMKNQIALLVQGADMITCETREEYVVLCKQGDLAASMRKQVEKYWDGTEETPGPVKKAYSLWKDLTGKRGAMLKPLESFISTVGKVGGQFLAIEQRREQERLDVIRKQAEEIRKKQEAEAAKEAEALRRKQEAEAKAQAERFKNSPSELARQAEILRVKQAEAQAQLKRDAEARMIDTAAIPTEAPKTEAGEGRAQVQTWKYRVKDLDLVPRSFMALNEKMVQSVVTAMKDKTQIPGIEVYMESSVRRTGK